MGTAVFKVEARRAASTSRRLAGAPGRIRKVLEAEFRGGISRDLRAAAADVAPYDEDDRDGIHLRDELEVKVSFGGGRINATLHSPVRSADGFAYTDVTRFGHEGPIVPRKSRWLKWPQGEGFVFARQSAGHHPATDWVEAAEEIIAIEVAAASKRVGRVMKTVVL